MTFTGITHLTEYAESNGYRVNVNTEFSLGSMVQLVKEFEGGYITPTDEYEWKVFIRRPGESKYTLEASCSSDDHPLNNKVQ